MKFTIENTNSFKLKLFSVALMLNYCGSLYLALSNNIFANIVAYGTLFLSLLHAALYIYFNLKKKKIVYWSIIYILIFCLYRYCARREILDLFTYVSFYSDVDFRKINNKIKKITTFFLLGTILLNFIHILPNAPLFYRGDMQRYTFGLNHPNAGGYYSFIIASTIFVESYSCPTLKKLIVILFLGIETYIVFNSRTAVMGIGIIAIFMLMKICRMDFLRDILTLRFSKYIVVLAVLGIVMLLLYISSNYQKFIGLNHLLSSRIENNFLFLQQYKISLFGNAQVPAWLSTEGVWGLRYLDSGYMQSLLCLGIINSVIYLLLFLNSMGKNLKNGNVSVNLLLMIIALMLIVEAAPLRWYFAFPVLYICDKKNDFYKHWRRKKRDEKGSGNNSFCIR